MRRQTHGPHIVQPLASWHRIALSITRRKAKMTNSCLGLYMHHFVSHIVGLYCTYARHTVITWPSSQPRCGVIYGTVSVGVCALPGHSHPHRSALEVAQRMK